MWDLPRVSQSPVSRIAHQNVYRNGNGNFVAAWAEGDLDEIEEVNANCILMANLQQALTLGTRTDKAPVYDSDGSAEVHHDTNCYDNDIFNMFTQEEQYTEILEPIPEPHQTQQNDSNVISVVFSVEQSGGTVEQHPATVEETRSYFESLYNNLAIEVEKEIANLNNQLSKEKSIVSSLNEEKKRFKSDFKIREDKLLDKQIQLENKIKELDNILVKTEAAKFVRGFKSLAKEADESLAKHKNLEFKIERLLRAVVSQDIMSIVQSNSDVDTSNLQTELDRDLKDKSKDTPCESDTLDPLSQKLENENVELEFRVLNYAKENAHLKTTYKNLFDSINVTRNQTKTIIEFLQEKVHNTIYENAKLRAQLFDKVSEQKDTTNNTRVNTKFENQSTSGTKLYSVTPFPNSKVIPKVGETNDLSKHSLQTRINPFKTYKEDKFVPINKVRASVRRNPITISQPHVITKKDVNFDSNGLSSIGVDNTAKTRRPQPRSNTKNDRVPSAPKSSCIKNKEVEVEEHHRNLPLSNNKKHISSKCNNIKLDIQNDKSEVVCAMLNQRVSLTALKVIMHVLLTLRNLQENGFQILLFLWHVIQICLWCVDSGCSKHMPGNLKLLINFVLKFLGTVRFGNDHIAAILGYGDLQWGNILITRVYFIDGLGNNLFSQGKSKKASHPPKPVPNSKQRLHILHMDLYGPMRVESINGKRYVLVIVDDYSCYTWVHFLRSKDEAPEEINIFLKKITVLLQAPVIIVRTKNGTEFKNQVLQEYFNSVGISHQASSVRTPQQNRAEAIATACYTHNHSIIHRRFNKTPYDLINGRKPDISFLHVFGALCYPKNDRGDIQKLRIKGDIGFFIGYSATSCAYRVYNRRTKKIIETMNVTFDELSAMAFEQRSSKPGFQSMTSGKISSGLELTYAPSTITTQKLTEHELDLLFEAMYDDYFGGQPSAATRTTSAAQAPQFLQTPKASTTIADITSTPTNSPSHTTTTLITS
ncbi:retrovirus-related pol polyprotein from transposon TNT 1-94 [Tanacetum coccineum]